MSATHADHLPIRTPDQKLRVYISSTLRELAAERKAARRAVEGLAMSPVMFELGARPHSPRDLYRAYIRQSDVFVGIYGERYGWVAPDEVISGLEDEYILAAPTMPKLIYVKEVVENREPRLMDLLNKIRDDDSAAFKLFSDAEELEELITRDLATLLAERFDLSRALAIPPAVLMATGREVDSSIDESYPPQSTMAGSGALDPSSTSHAPAGPIFVVHGRDHSMLDRAKRVIEQTTGREVMVLQDLPNAGRTILEKFEQHAIEAAFAVVLFTADDEGGLAGAPVRSRGRQNVVFELGFFFGRLGRRRVAVLLDSGIERPSDIDGLLYIGLDREGQWEEALCREISAAGIRVDLGKLPSP